MLICFVSFAQAVANILTNYGIDHLPTLMAAILHDTVEDTDTTLQEIASLFGDDVASIVEVSRTDQRITSYMSNHSGWL
jgi:(p)ppGpp synthase/HD superfamily hydrolase